MNWPIVKLGDVFEIARGGSPRPIDEYITDAPEGHNWVMISDATSSNKIIYKTKKKIKPEGLRKTRAVTIGDFILSNSMSFGRPYIMGTDGCIHDGWLLLRPKIENFDPDYFYHYLGSSLVYAKFSSLAAGATVKNLNADLVRNVHIPLPPLEEQKRIAGILDQADALRRLRARALEKLNILGQALFQEMFGKPHPEWLKVRVSDVTKDARTGPFGSQLLVSEFVESGIPVLGIDNVVQNEFRWAKERFITIEKFNQLKRFQVKPADVLVTIMGTCGRCAIVPPDIGPAINTKHICCMTVQMDQIIPEFLKASLLWDSGVLMQLGVEAKGAIMPGLNMGKIANLELNLPPLSLQNDFKSKLNLIDEQRVIAKSSLDTQEDLFASLQSSAFKGNL